MRPDFRLTNFRDHIGFLTLNAFSMTEEALVFAFGMEGVQTDKITAMDRLKYRVSTDQYQTVMRLPMGTHRITIYGEEALMVVGMNSQVLTMAQDEESHISTLQLTGLFGRPEYEQQFHAVVKEIKAESLWVPEPLPHEPKPSTKKVPTREEMAPQLGLMSILHGDGSHEHIFAHEDGTKEKISCEVFTMIHDQNLILNALIEWIEAGTLMGLKIGRAEMLDWIVASTVRGSGENGKGGHHG